MALIKKTHPNATVCESMQNIVHESSHHTQDYDYEYIYGRPYGTRGVRNLPPGLMTKSGLVRGEVDEEDDVEVVSGSLQDISASFLEFSANIFSTDGSADELGEEAPLFPSFLVQILRLDEALQFEIPFGCPGRATAVKNKFDRSVVL